MNREQPNRAGVLYTQGGCPTSWQGGTNPLVDGGDWCNT